MRSLPSWLLSAAALFCYAPNSEAVGGNVILLMLDGVRWQEVFRGADPRLQSAQEHQVLFPGLMTQLQSGDGVLFGDRDLGVTMKVGNPMNMSLPAYQSIMAGRPQPCLSNRCGRIEVETFPERVVRELSLPAEKVAAVASWAPIRDAMEHVPGSLFVNVGFEPMRDSAEDEESGALNKLQINDVPSWKHARRDQYTFAHALRYLKKHEPRFLFISLNDSDEWGHKRNYDRYARTLEMYDQWISQLVSRIDAMGEYGRNTTLIVTTDHGRGKNRRFSSHGPLLPSSRFVWMFARSPLTKQSRQTPVAGYSHLDLRPTIEAAMGLRPIVCENCGQIIRQIVQ